MKQYIKPQLITVSLCAIIFSCSIVFGKNYNHLNKNDYYLNANFGLAYPNKIKKYLYNLHTQNAYMSVKPKKSLVYGLGLGYTINNYIRLELDWHQFNKFKIKGSYKENTNSMLYKQNIKSNYFGMNAYYDIAFKKDFSAFLTAGLGLAINRAGSLKKYRDGNLNVFRESYEKKNFAYTVGAGLSKELSENINVDLFYKFYDLGKVQSKGLEYASSPISSALFALSDKDRVGGKLRVQSISVGIRYYM